MPGFRSRDPGCAQLYNEAGRWQPNFFRVVGSRAGRPRNRHAPGTGPKCAGARVPVGVQFHRGLWNGALGAVTPTHIQQKQIRQKQIQQKQIIKANP
jgi:hypothetical protein